MNSVQTWGEAISMSLFGLWDKFIGFLPSLVGALFVFFAGLIVATAVGKAVEKLFQLLRVDQVVSKS